MGNCHLPQQHRPEPMTRPEVIIINNGGYLELRGLKSLIEELAPMAIISTAQNLMALTPQQQQEATFFSFAPVAGIETVVIDTKASEEETRQTVKSTLPSLTIPLSTDTGSATITEKKTTEKKLLSKRETEILKLAANGLINKEIASRLSISLQTVLTHRKHISAKLGIKTVSGLTAYAMMNGLI